MGKNEEERARAEEIGPAGERALAAGKGNGEKGAAPRVRGRLRAGVALGQKAQEAGGPA